MDSQNNNLTNRQAQNKPFNQDNPNSSPLPYPSNAVKSNVNANQPFSQAIQEEQKQERQQPSHTNNDFARRVSSSSPSSHSSSSRSHSQSQQSQQQKWQYQSIKQGQQGHGQNDNNLHQQQKNPSAGNQLQQNKNPKPIVNKVIRYKYCCKKCKHADRDRDKKACVCVVPRNQRRTHLGCQGCQTCGCTGCSKDDFIFRGQDPEYHPETDNKKTQNSNKKKQVAEMFQARNGCCKNCMKAFSKSNKSCICQVPQDVRKTKLSSTGCKICGCQGCNPQDKKGENYSNSKVQKKQKRSRSRSQRKKDKKQKRSKQKEKKKRSKSRQPQIIDTYTMNFYNIDRSIIGSMIINQYQIDPALLGFGIPQRSSSYLLCKSKQK